MAAFEEDLAISRRLAEQDPSNAGWQSGLAAALNRVGGVLEAQGKLTEAMAAFEEALAIRRRLAAEQDPLQLGLAIGFGGDAQPRGRGAGGAGQADGGDGRV